MKNKTFIWLVGALLLGVPLWYWSRGGTTPALAHDAASFKPRSTPVQSAAPIRANPVTTAISQRQIKDVIEKERVHEKKIWDFGFAKPIRFYGKVVDETGEAVAGAKARISMHNSGVNNTKVEQVTDAKGLFSVSGHGLGLGVMVSKQGYYTCHNPTAARTRGSWL